MSTSLSKALQKYYVRKGNRVIFSNGMTLNKLAQEMWERLNFREIDASVMSKVLKGQRTMNIDQLQVFCEILKLDVDNKNRLKLALQETILAKLGFEQRLDLSEKLLGESINKINQLRLKGMVELSTEWCEQLMPYFSSPKTEKDILLYVKLIREYICCVGEVLDPKISFNKITNLTNILRLFAKDLHDENLLRLADYHLGTAAYMSKRFDKALYYLISGIDAEKTIMEDVNAISAGMISAATEQANENFDFFKEKALLVVDKCDYGAATTLFGGLAIAEAIHGNIFESHEYFGRAETFNKLNTLRNGPQTVLKTIQLRKTQMMIGLKDIKVAREGIALAEGAGYTKYIKEFNQLVIGL